MNTSLEWLLTFKADLGGDIEREWMSAILQEVSHWTNEHKLLFTTDIKPMSGSDKGAESGMPEPFSLKFRVYALNGARQIPEAEVRELFDHVSSWLQSKATPVEGELSAITR